MKKTSLYPFLLLSLLPSITQAVCPVCTVAVGGGIGLARYLGVDDIVTGVWAGAFLVLLAYWLQVWLTKIKKNFSGSLFIGIIIMYILTFAPLHYTNFMIVHGHTIFNIDRLIFGSIIGSAGMLLAEIINNLIKEYNGGKVKFKFQKVIVPVSILVLTSEILYLLVKKAII